MSVTPYNAIALQDFLKLPETQPSSEYLDGKVIQKPMPKARHSRLQNKLIQAINEVAEDAQIAYGFSELRCTFGDRWFPMWRCFAGNASPSTRMGNRLTMWRSRQIG